MQQTIRTMHHNGESNWEILAYVESLGYTFQAAKRIVTAALRLPADEVAEMLDSYENNI
jgi:hypothetical protein